MPGSADFDAAFCPIQRNGERDEMEELNDRLLEILKIVHTFGFNETVLTGLDQQWERSKRAVDDFYLTTIGNKSKQFDDADSSLKTLIQTLKNELKAGPGLIKGETNKNDQLKKKIEEELEKLSKVEAKIQIFNRRLDYLEEDVTNARREKDGLDNEIAKILQDIKIQQKETKLYEDRCKQLEDAIAEDVNFYKQDMNAILSKEIDITWTPPHDTGLNDMLQKLRDNFLTMDGKRKDYLNDIFSQTIKMPAISDFPERSQIDELNREIIDMQMANNSLNIEVHNIQAKIQAELGSGQCLAFQELHLTKIRDENEIFRKKLDVVGKINVSLKEEIERYRAMLGTIKVPIAPAPPRRVVEEPASILNGHHESSETRKTIRTRKDKGRVKISAIAESGTYIELENISVTEDRHLKDWKLERKVDGNPTIIFTFPDYTLKAGKSVRIWSYGQSSSVEQHLIDFFEIEQKTSWLIGVECTTVLTNANGQEEAIWKDEYTSTIQS